MLTQESAFRKDRIHDSPKFQHRHFALIARVIASELAAGHNYSHEEIVEAFAAALRATNVNFDCGRFGRACGAVE